MRESEVSLLIVTWDGDALLKRCLESVVAVYGRLPETIVVDNAALDSTRQLVAGFANAKYIASPSNLGFSGGNNLGLKHCTKEWIVLLNNDTEFGGDALTPLVEFAQSHPAAAIMQGRIVRGDNPTLHDFCGFQLSPIGQQVSYGERAAVDDPRFAVPFEIFAPNGAFVLVRKSALTSIGGLFHDEFKSYYEDVDIGTRAWLCGFECWFVPTPPVLHFGGRTSRRFADDVILGQGYINHWYSILISFGWFGRMYFGLLLDGLTLIHALIALCKGNAAPWRMWRWAKRQLSDNHAFISRKRREIRSQVTRSDLSFMRKVVTRQPWAYYRGLLGV